MLSSADMIIQPYIPWIEKILKVRSPRRDTLPGTAVSAVIGDMERLGDRTFRSRYLEIAIILVTVYL